MTSKVTGIAETKRALRQVAALVAPAANEACKRSLEPTLAVAKENVGANSKKSGTLQKALILKRVKDLPKTKPRYVVGVKPGSPARRYAHVDEFGRAPNANGKGGYKGKRSLTRAFEATKAGAVEIFGKTFGPALEKSAARIAARKAKAAS